MKNEEKQEKYHHQSKLSEETLIIQDVSTLKDLNIIKRRSKKTKILLYDTKRRFDDFINKLKYRNNGKYNDIPHFIIKKNGDIYQLFDIKYNSVTFNDYDIDKKFVKIAFENLGWLNKNTITGVLYNWINDKYRSNPYIKKWRGHYYWDEYTEKQKESAINLCKHICNITNIPYKSVSSHGYVENIANFDGIVSKSNFLNIYTHINPSFDFNIFYNDKDDKK